MIETAEEALDFTKVPESKGIPRSLPVAGVIGIMCIAAIASFTVLTASHGRIWPSATSMRVDLGQMPGH